MLRGLLFLSLGFVLHVHAGLDVETLLKIQEDEEKRDKIARRNLDISNNPLLAAKLKDDDAAVQRAGAGDASPAPASPGRSSFRRISGAIRAEKEQQSPPQQATPEPRTKRLSLEEQLEMVAPTAPPPSAGGWDGG